MKQYVQLTFLMLLCVAILLPQVAANPVLRADILRYEPLPAQPGQYVTVWVEIENTGTSDAPRAALEVMNQFPFTVVDDAQREFGTIKSQQSFVEEFEIRVGSEAVVGTNQLQVRFTPDSALGQWQESDLPINVRSNDATLAIAQVTTTPESVIPGDEVQLALTLENTAGVVLRNIGVELDLVEAQGTSFVDYPFIPSGSSAQKTLAKLNPGEAQTISFTLKSYPTATPGYYKLPLVLTFFDESGTESTQQDYAGLIVQAAPELKVYFEESTLRRDDEQGTITLQFVNKGVSDLKFLDIELLATEEYEVVGAAKQYLGDLDSDDFRSESFTIKPLVQDPTLQVDVTYRDQNNEAYARRLETPLRYDESPVQQTNPTGIGLTVLVVLGLVVWWWRRRKHKNRR